MAIRKGQFLIGHWIKGFRSPPAVREWLPLFLHHMGLSKVLYTIRQLISCFISTHKQIDVEQKEAVRPVSCKLTMGTTSHYFFCCGIFVRKQRLGPAHTWWQEWDFTKKWLPEGTYHYNALQKWSSLAISTPNTYISWYSCLFNYLLQNCKQQ